MTRYFPGGTLGVLSLAADAGLCLTMEEVPTLGALKVHAASRPARTRSGVCGARPFRAGGRLLSPFREQVAGC